ncbi:MAG: hypothetical protein JW760_02160 [Spirochaetales bacterium]|nr:hypothetical protein [Spirochaetales bacterium]
MKRFTAVSALVTIVLLFFSCGDSELFFDSGGDEGIIIESIAEGAVLKTGDGINVSLIYDEGIYNPESLEILLLDQNGEIVGNTLLTGADLADPIPPIILPVIDPGLYILRYVIRTDDEIVSEEEFPFFHTDEEYLVQGITIYPPVLLPGGSGLLQADIRVPQNSDPYVRWSNDDSLIYQGFLSQGADRIEWNAPAETGVYTLSFELFPFNPQFSGSDSFHSTLSHAARVYVTEKQGATKGELVPEGSYFSLFHFRGSLIDAVAGVDAIPLRNLGNPKLDIREGVFGYYLDGASGFFTSGSLLPLSQSDPAPFSVTLRFLPEGEQIEKDFFSLFDDGDRRVFYLATDSTGSPSLELTQGFQSALVTAEVSSYELENLRELTVSVVPQEKGTLIQWFADGLFAGSSIVPFTFSLSEGKEYRSSIGGENGFTGVIDEFGVYVRSAVSQESSADYGAYERRMKEEYGKSLLLADGLDGYLDTEKYTPEGAFSFTGGALELAPGTTLVSPELPFSGGDLKVVIPMESGAGEIIYISTPPDREGVIRLSLLPPEDEAYPFPLVDNVLVFRLFGSAEGLTLSPENGEPAYQLRGSFEVFKILVDNNSPEDLLLIQSLLVHNGGTSLAENPDTGTSAKNL